jgi:heat shock protein HslJ
MKRLAVLAIAGASLAACATPPPPPPPPPAGPITFRLVTLAGRAPAFDGVTITLDGARANGSTGCNTYLALRDSAPNAARPLAWFQITEVACSDVQMALERQWLETLDSTRAVETAGSELVLKDAAGAELARMVRGPAPAPAGS